jgi:hypothetical protein
LFGSAVGIAGTTDDSDLESALDALIHHGIPNLHQKVKRWLTLCRRRPPMILVEQAGREPDTA